MDATIVLLAAVYFGLLLGLVFFIGWATAEYFQAAADASAANPADRCEGFADQSTCFHCMDYFQEVLGLQDTSQIPSYAEARTRYLLDVLGKFKALIKDAERQCRTEADIAAEAAGTPPPPVDAAKAVECFRAKVVGYMKQCEADGLARSECAVISRLADAIVAKANQCGAEPCTLKQFQDKFEAAAAEVESDVKACQQSFATATSECTKTYAAVIETRKDTAAPIGSAAAPSPAVTAKDLDEAMSRMASFVVSNSI